MIRDYYVQQPGYGICLAYELTRDQPVGWACLKDLDGTRNREIGYRLSRISWGKGYATELAKALVEYGFKKKRLKKIVAVTHPENIGSKKVLEKARLTFVKQAYHYQSVVDFYQLYRCQWQSSPY